MLDARKRQAQLARLTKICTAFPEVDVRTVQHTAFSVRGKKFAYYLVDHHGDGRVSMQCKAERGVNQALVDADSQRFFLPPYMAHHGWIGLYLDAGTVNWDEVGSFLADGYRLTAPKRLAAMLAT